MLQPQPTGVEDVSALGHKRPPLPGALPPAPPPLMSMPAIQAAAPVAVPAPAPAAPNTPGVVKDILVSGARSVLLAFWEAY